MVVYLELKILYYLKIEFYDIDEVYYLKIEIKGIGFFKLLKWKVFIRF